MPRDYKVHLEDILEAIQKVRDYTAGHTLKTFAQDSKTFDAVVRNLEVIGEAAKKIPEGLRARHHEIDWRRFAGLRDILIHEYFRVDVEIVWDIVQHKLRPLETGIKKVLAD